jgi:hypothetical protein
VVVPLANVPETLKLTVIGTLLDGMFALLSLRIRTTTGLRRFPAVPTVGCVVNTSFVAGVSGTGSTASAHVVPTRMVSTR